MSNGTERAFIPAASPRANYLAHKEQVDQAIRRVLDGGVYILGRETESFEGEFASFLGLPHAIGVGSGTDAIHLALRACGIGPGDAVATVSHTAVATVAAIELSGATPLLVDVVPATYTMDPVALDVLLHSKQGAVVKAVIVVHLYGHPADMQSICAIARTHGLRVIEDCAQSHGAMLDGRRTGTFGDIAAFSFYPTKNLGALGDGGAVATADHELAIRLRQLREYGWQRRYISEMPGMNTRLDEMQAAILRTKLLHLDAENGRRIAIAQRYTKALSDVSSITFPQKAGNTTHVFHQYVIRTARRDRLMAALKDAGIGTAIHYPQPVHLQPAYRHLAPVGSLPNTERICPEILSLPMYPELSDEAIDRVAGQISGWMSAAAQS